MCVADRIERIKLEVHAKRLAAQETTLPRKLNEKRAVTVSANGFTRSVFVAVAVDDQAATNELLNDGLVVRFSGA